MKNRHLHTVVIAALLAAGLGASAAHAEGLYVGGSLGVPHFNDSINGIPGSGQGASGKLFGGYQITPNFAVEGGAALLGHISNASGTVHSHGEFLDAVGLLPLGSDWSLLGSVGLAHVDLNTSNGDDRGLGLKLGLGAEYNLTRSIALRGEWEDYKPSTFGAHPGIGQYTLGVRVGF